MTHKTYTLTTHCNGTRNNSLQVKGFVTPGADEYFKLDEWLWSAEFKNCVKGDYEVTFRLNVASPKSIRRFVMRVVAVDGTQVQKPQVVTIDPNPGLQVETTVVPKVVVPYFHVEPEHVEVFSLAARMLKKAPNQPVRILMVGPSGYGKTSLPKHFATVNEMGYFRMNCAAIRDPEEWFGYREARDGSTHFVPSNFIEKVTAGNCVVVLDEFNRLEPWLTNTLYGLLDSDARTVVNNTEFVVGPNVIFVMTINLGFQFAGTFSLDVAMTNRVDMFCEVGPMSPTNEVEVLHTNTGLDKTTAAKVVETANVIRKFEGIECSTRTTLQIARLIVAGSNIRSAFQHAVVMRCKSDPNLATVAKSVIDVVNNLYGVYRVPAMTSFTKIM